MATTSAGVPSLAEQHAFLDAAQKYDFAAVRAAVERMPAIINVQPSGRWSALHQVAQVGDEATVRFLLEHGADGTAKTKDGQTPLSVAHAKCRELLAKELAVAPNGSKRSAELVLEGQPEAKVTVSSPTEGPKVTLDIKLVSGESLTSISVSASSTCADVQAKLQPLLKPATAVQALLHGGKQLGFTENFSLLAAAGGSVVLQAVIGGTPALRLYEPCSATELSDKYGEWIDYDNDQDMCKTDFAHGSMEDASLVAKSVADEMAKAFPGMKDARVVLSNEVDSCGEVMAISNPGSDPKEACLTALGVLDEYYDEGTCENKDWKDYAERGFNRSEGDGDNADDEEGNAEKAGFIAVTKIMADKLTGHFEFNFKDGGLFACAPMIYGGYASDGSIVGVLTARVWT